MVVVVIPVYKENITGYEDISLKQCCKLLGAYPVTLVKPRSLQVENYFSYCDGWKTESFDDEYFSSVEGYNKLMMSEEFYRRFVNYRYILIHQLDAFVFKDELLLWCKKGYDYIGAPWLENETISRSFMERMKFRYRNYVDYKTNAKQPGSVYPTASQFYYKVGNGGFSLRNVRKMADICESMNKDN